MKLAKDKNRARDARLKAAKEATNKDSHSIEFHLSSQENGGKKKKGLLRGPVGSLPPPEGNSGSEDPMTDVGPNEEEEEEDPDQRRIRVRMEAAMHDAEGEDTGPDSDGLSGSDVEGLDGDFAFSAGEGEADSIVADGDVELEEISGDDEEMKDPEAEDDEYDDAEWADSIGINGGTGGRGGDSLPARKRKRGEEAPPRGSPTSLGNPDYLPDELFTQAAAAITAREVRRPTDSKAKEVKKKKRNQKRTKSKDLLVG